MIRTPLCDLLGIEYPVFQGGMAWIADGKLAAAVSEGGGLGIIAAGNAPGDAVREQIQVAKSLTSRPFGVNIMLMSPFVEEVAQVVAEEKVAVVTTGMVSYADLAKQDSPSLATAFELVGADWAAKIISFGIVLGLATVVMVLLLGLTRIVFAMSRDGLLPRGLSKTGKHGTPAALQIVVGAVVALVAAFFDIGVLSDMVNIGTLSAFTLVAISIPIMRKKRPDLPRAFKMPGSPWIPILIAVANFWLMLNLSVLTWIRFVVWLVVGFAIYFGYGYWHARLGKGDLTETLSAETDKAVNG